MTKALWVQFKPQLHSLFSQVTSVLRADGWPPCLFISVQHVGSCKCYNLCLKFTYIYVYIFFNLKICFRDGK